MESICVILEPHKSVLGNIASIVTYFHQLSGVLVCNSIRKEKSTANRSLIPFLIGGVMGWLVLRFGAINNDVPILRVGIVGSILSILYIGCFLYYTNNEKDKTLARTQIGYAGAFVAAVYAYSFVESPDNLPFRFGMIFTIVMLFFICHPVITLFRSIRKKSTEGVPFPMIATGTAISLSWLLYGLATREYFGVIQNGFVCIINSIQLLLFVIYPSKANKSPSKAKKNGSSAKNANNNNNNNNNKKKN